MEKDDNSLSSVMHSRLCVKNLPKNATEAKLREVFSSKGAELTDVRLVKSSKGQSRLFGFIGFRHESDAKVAKTYFNNTFMGSVKISVEYAVKVGDKNIENKAWSKHTKDKVAKIKQSEETTNKTTDITPEATTTIEVDKSKDKKVDKISKDKLDFLEVMKPRHTAKKWANDENMDVDALPTSATAVDSDDDSVDDDYNDITTAKQSSSTTTSLDAEQLKLSSELAFLRSKVKSDFSDDEASDAGSEAGSDDEDAFDNHRKDRSAQPASKSKTATTAVIFKEPTASVTMSKAKIATTTEQEATSEAQLDKPKDIPEPVDEELDAIPTGRLFIRNLPYGCTEDDIRTTFAPYGSISEVHLPINQDKRSKGYGYVQYMIPEHASKAMSELDGSSFQGRLLHIILAKDKRTQVTVEPEEGDDRMSTYKLQKEKDRKSMANMKDSWNASYIRSDTVVSALSEKYGVRRSDVLNAGESGGELAVRLAIGETQVLCRGCMNSLAYDMYVYSMLYIPYTQQIYDLSATSLVINLPYAFHPCYL